MAEGAGGNMKSQIWSLLPGGSWSPGEEDKKGRHTPDLQAESDQQPGRMGALTMAGAWLFGRSGAGKSQVYGNTCLPPLKTDMEVSVVYAEGMTRAKALKYDVMYQSAPIYEVPSVRWASSWPHCTFRSVLHTREGRPRAPQGVLRVRK